MGIYVAKHTFFTIKNVTPLTACGTTLGQVPLRQSTKHLGLKTHKSGGFASKGSNLQCILSSRPSHQSVGHFRLKAQSMRHFRLKAWSACPAYTYLARLPDTARWQGGSLEPAAAGGEEAGRTDRPHCPRGVLCRHAAAGLSASGYAAGCGVGRLGSAGLCAAGLSVSI